MSTRSRLRSTATATIVAGLGTGASDGYSPLVDGPPEPWVWRGDLVGRNHAPSLDRAKSLLSFVHLTDLHVMDASSPARAEAVHRYADDPRWKPMLPMHRPQEFLVPWAVDAFARGLASSPTSPWRGDPFAFALVTGDCIDNAQRNELDAYLALLDGGAFALPYDGVACEAFAGLGYWSPEPDIDDPFSRRGFPKVPGLLDAVSRPVRASGLGLPWFAAIGNHDVMRAGTAFSSPKYEAIAVGDRKAIDLPSQLRSNDSDDIVALFLADPATYHEGAPTQTVRSDPDRRAISRDEFLAAHQRHGFDGGVRGDYVVDTEHVRLVFADTNHPTAYYTGSVGRAQLEWIEEQIADARSAASRAAVLVTHHGSEALTNVTPSTEQRLTGDPVLAALHRHRNVVAWISGHRHLNRVVPHLPPVGTSGRGFWEIVTSSVIDWPSQIRSLDFAVTADGEFVLVSTLLDHGAPLRPTGSTDGVALAEHVDAFGALHRELSYNVAGSRASARSGSGLDRNVILGLPSRP